MLALTILFIALILILSVLWIEHVDNKRYQNLNDQEQQKSTPTEPSEPVDEIVKEKLRQEEPEPQVEEKPEIEETPEEVEKVQPEVELKEVIEEVQPEVTVEVESKKEPETEEIIEEVIEDKELPECKYPPFTHVRLVEMGLSDDEATEFVNELIPQLEEQVPLIEEAISNANFHQVEKLTHGIKGSATNIGTGGVADFLTEFNTYLKSGTDVDIIKAYHAHFIRYIEELKKQYS